MCHTFPRHVSVGSQVDEFQPLCEVQSDKATVEITSRYKGKITAVHHKIGEMAKVGSPLVEIEVDGDDNAASSAAPSSSSAAAAAAPAAANVAVNTASGNAGYAPLGEARGIKDVLSTPAVRFIAKENNVDLTKVRGSGRDGRVVKEDIMAYLQGVPSAQASAAAPASAQPQTMVIPSKGSAAPAAPVATAPVALAADKRVVLTGVPKAMVKTMTAAALIPHLGFSDEYIVDGLHNARETLRPIMEARGIKLTYMPFIIKTFSLALKSYPIMNSVLEPTGDAYIMKGNSEKGGEYGGKNWKNWRIQCSRFQRYNIID